MTISDALIFCYFCGWPSRLSFSALITRSIVYQRSKFQHNAMHVKLLINKFCMPVFKGGFEVPFSHDTQVDQTATNLGRL